MTAETKAADALLQRPQPVTIGNKTYHVSPPSLATLMLVSEELSLIPQELFSVSKEDDVTLHALRSARHAHGLARAIARIILGAPTPFPSLLERIFNSVRPDPMERLAKRLSVDHSPRELALAFVELAQRLEVGDFFAFTAFLSALRITAPTQEEKVVMTPTAPGH